MIGSQKLIHRVAYNIVQKALYVIILSYVAKYSMSVIIYALNFDFNS